MSSLDVLNQYLHDFSSTNKTSERENIETTIWKQFGKTGLVCVIDMCGFTQASQQHGIIYYLALVKRMQAIVKPMIEAQGGKVVKFEADNCFARFNSTDEALSAIKGILESVKQANLATPNDLDITLSIGMDFGDYLLLKSNDYWGDAVNRASKLGEDLAGSDVVLLTDSAWENIQNKDKFEVTKSETKISKVFISTYEIHIL